ncbi:hypothetical protein [Pseudoteredinibacter isoporae]|uniref:hypothetical protein n=1 Tax=Pseudoteredinibacter isoporae TaxID=570281 RepID=UPI003108626B
MSSVIVSISNALDLVKRLNAISKNIGDAEFSNALADLNMELAKSKIELASVIEENAGLKTKITKLKKKINKIKKTSEKENLTFKGYAYFTEDDDGPFCSNCVETKNMKVRLKEAAQGFKVFGEKCCPSCDQYYNEVKV